MHYKHQNILSKWCNYSTMVSTLDHFPSTIERMGLKMAVWFIPGPISSLLWLRSPLRVACTFSLSTLSWVEEETPGPLWCCINKNIYPPIFYHMYCKYLSKQGNNKPDFTPHSCREIIKTLLRTRAPYSFPHFLSLTSNFHTHIYSP